jgi:hypothetical protein
VQTFLCADCQALLCVGPASQSHGCVCAARSLHLMAMCAAVQDLRLHCIFGPDGGFLAKAPPSLRSLHMKGLPDFRVRGLLCWESILTGIWSDVPGAGVGLLHMLCRLPLCKRGLLCRSCCRSSALRAHSV